MGVVYIPLLLRYNNTRVCVRSSPVFKTHMQLHLHQAHARGVIILWFFLCCKRVFIITYTYRIVIRGWTVQDDNKEKGKTYTYFNFDFKDIRRTGRTIIKKKKYVLTLIQTLKDIQYTGKYA